MTENSRYTAIAIALHWAIALLILGNVAGGLFMHNLPNSSPIKFDLYQLHKSFGLSILILSLLRLGWRLGHKAPALPQATPDWQRFGARAAHWAFYGFMIIIPLTGWAMVSVSPLEIPTYFFGVIPVPHLPFFGGVADRAGWEDILAETHEYLAFGLLGLLALHAGAALKHHFIDKDNVVQSMAPARRHEWIGFAAILAVLGFGAVVYAIAPAPASGTPSAAAPLVEQAGASEEAAVSSWLVEYDASRLEFTGAENGRSFNGSFKEFSAEINFDPDNLEASRILVVVAARSADTGDSTRDSTIPSNEWFDAENFPTARFVSEDIRETGEGAYGAHGVLMIKEYIREIVLPFTLEIDGDSASAQGGVDVIRTDYGLGLDDSWLNAEGVALEVRVEFEIEAARAD